MKIAAPLLLLVLLVSRSFAASEIIKFRFADGDATEGKLSLPADAANVRVLVIYVHGTGPATYLNKRKGGNVEFSYYDTFAEEFNRRGVAFFTYNKRGVTLGDQPPVYEIIDREKFKKVVPSIEVKDLQTYISTLRKDKRLKKTKIVLLGWSEGSVIAAMAAEDKKNKIDALFLAGYVHDNMSDVIKWQNTGGSAIVNIRPYFDKDKDNAISRAEYESEEAKPANFRIRAFQGAKFEQLDVNKDDRIDAADFGLLTKTKYQAVLDAIQRGDDEWIWNNYFHITTAWLKEHFALEANKERLLRLKLPIYIFHGEDDANCDVNGVYDLRKRFNAAGKKNLREFVFKDHDHNLNFTNWIFRKEIPDGIKKMLETAEEFKK
jgi:alpha-beta hydrolase superfamily lysophospholipase